MAYSSLQCVMIFDENGRFWREFNYEGMKTLGKNLFLKI